MAGAGRQELGGAADLERELAESREREAALAAVLGIMRRGPGEPDVMLNAVLETVATNAVRLCAADNGSIAQLKSDGWRLVANVGDLDQESMERNWGNQPIEANRRSLTGRVLMDRRTTTIVDAQADPEYDAGVGLINIRSIIGVPLTRGEDIVGVLILRRQEPKPFTPEEIHLLETFADQASIAIENVRLFQETKHSLDRQTAIGQVLQAMTQSTPDLLLVCKTIVGNVVRLCRADNATIHLADGDVYRHAASATNSGRFADAPAFERVSQEATRKSNLTKGRTTVVGRVLLEMRSVQIPDTLADPEYDIKRAPEFMVALSGRSARTLLGVPIIRESAVVGIIIARRHDVKPFTPDEIGILETFADQASIAIENVRLFDETKDQLERETATSEILRVTAQSTYEVQPVLDAVIAKATRLAGAENGFVYQVVGEVLHMTAAVGEKAELMREWQRTNPIRANDRGTATGRAISEGRTVHVPDIFADPTYTYWEAQRLGNFRTLLTVPLTRQGTNIGVIAMWRTEMKPFSDKEINLVQTFADQAAVAIANVELFRTVERQRGELSRFLSPQVAALVTSDQGAKMLEGHRRQITVAFCDLRNFTAFAETAEPEEVLGVLRDYHRAMGELIVEHQGTLEHFAGDGMMVFFNDPVLIDRHELQAVRMACAMRERFDQMARAWQKRGYDLGFGVGIATGYATLGRIGFEGRYDYGAIGNVVILAQRLSAEAKAGQILLSQRVQAAVEGDAETTSVGDLVLKGFTRPVPAFAAESVKTPARS
jgi:GAF domain-containing protein